MRVTILCSLSKKLQLILNISNILHTPFCNSDNSIYLTIFTSKADIVKLVQNYTYSIALHCLCASAACHVHCLGPIFIWLGVVSSTFYQLQFSNILNNWVVSGGLSTGNQLKSCPRELLVLASNLSWLTKSNEYHLFIQLCKYIYILTQNIPFSRSTNTTRWFWEIDGKGNERSTNENFELH